MYTLLEYYIRRRILFVFDVFAQ